MNSGDNLQEYRRRTRQGQLDGLFYLGCIAFGLAIGFMLQGWP